MISPQRIVSIVLISGQLTACTTWRAEAPSPAEVIGVQHPAAVRVEHIDGHREVLYKPEVKGDSVLGRRAVSDPGPNRALSLTEIKQLATEHVSTSRTLGLVLGVGLIAAVVVHAVNNAPIGNINLGSCC